MYFGEDLDFSAVCRTCLGTRDLNPIFKKTTYPKRFSKSMLKVTGLQVGINDGLPQNMCKKCLQHIKTSITFQMNCRRAEKTLKMQSAYIKIIENRELDSAENIKKVIKTETPEEEPQELDIDALNLLLVDIKDEFEIKYDIIEPSETQDVKTESGNDPEINYKVWGKETVECPTCNMKLQRASLKLHTRVKHAGLGPVCDHCGNQFSNNFRLNEHKRSKHGYEKFKCSQCEFRSATTLGLINHERRHTGEKPFICELCGASFHAAYLVSQHKQSHRTERLLKCDRCPASFKTNNGLHTHRAACHGSVGRYACQQCKRTYSYHHSLVRHMRTVHRYVGEDVPFNQSCEQILAYAANTTHEVQMRAEPVQAQSWTDIASDIQLLPTAGNRTPEVHIAIEPIKAQSWTDIASDIQLSPTAGNRTPEVHIGAEPIQAQSWIDNESDKQLLHTAGNRTPEVHIAIEPIKAQSWIDNESDKQLLHTAGNRTPEVHIAIEPIKAQSWTDIASDIQLLPTAGNRTPEVHIGAEPV